MTVEFDEDYKADLQFAVKKSFTETDLVNNVLEKI